jgi:pyruvate kinase
LIKLGVNVFRCNFSHGSDEEQLLRVEAARKVGNDLGLPVSFLLDTKGPEIRVGKIENKEVKITSGSILIIEAVHKIVGNHERITVLDATGKYNMAHDVKVGS